MQFLMSTSIRQVMKRKWPTMTSETIKLVTAKSVLGEPDEDEWMLHELTRELRVCNETWDVDDPRALRRHEAGRLRGSQLDYLLVGRRLEPKTHLCCTHAIWIPFRYSV